MKLQIIYLSLFFGLVNLQAQTYPFVLPDNITATLSVDSTRKENFKNQLLGYNIEGFQTNLQKDFLRKFNPVSIRFPHGVWANFYQWQTDGYQNDSYDNGSHETTLETYVRSVKGHINSIAALNTERKQLYGQGFHMMWTYSMNFDDAASCVARAKKDIALGLELKDIELGNEHFWTNQRSNQTKTNADFFNRAKSVAAALRAEFPDVRVSIPLGWRRNQESYNKSIVGDKSYYDAITLHKYMGADPDIPGESNSAYNALLTARLTLADDVNWIRSHGGAKPIWLTEWGVSANGAAENNSAACLGMADVYLFMSENQHIYDRANWFSFNRILNSMVYVTIENKREPVYPLQKRGYLMVYEILHNAFLDAKMLQSSMSTTKINNSLGAMNIVNARIVEKNGMKMIVAVNLSNKAVNFVLKFGNTTYDKNFNHRALVFNELGSVPNIGIDVDPTVLIKSGSGAITLPPLSVNSITLDEATTYVSGVKLKTVLNAYPNPSLNAVFNLHTVDKWAVYTSLGQQIASGEGSKIDLSAYPSAMYILKTASGFDKLLSK